MTFRLDEAIALLRRTPAVLDRMLRDLPEAWLHCDEGQDTWSPYVVLGHLIHGERTDWIPRARMILEHGERRTFEPFDRTAQLRDERRPPVGELLDELARAREQSLAALAAMQLLEADLDRRGRHPHFGTVTLRQLLATWVAHDLDHVQQIVRVMARRYAEDVGPWSEYLRIVRPV